jgi:hypothetical protein
VPSLIELVLHPDRRKPAPDPVPVSLAPAFAVGSVGWLLALGAVLMWPGFPPNGVVVSTCLVGAVLGGLGLLWDRRHRRR